MSTEDLETLVRQVGHVIQAARAVASLPERTHPDPRVQDTLARLRAELSTLDAVIR